VGFDRFVVDFVRICGDFGKRVFFRILRGSCGVFSVFWCFGAFCLVLGCFWILRGVWVGIIRSFVFCLWVGFAVTGWFALVDFVGGWCSLGF